MRSAVAGRPSFVCEVDNGISSTKKIGSAVYVPYWKVEVKSNESFHVRGVGMDDKIDPWYVLQENPDAHVCVRQAKLWYEYRT